MELKFDTPYHYWIETNTGKILSPTFDSESDAINWYGIISKYIFDEYGFFEDAFAESFPGE